MKNIIRKLIFKNGKFSIIRILLLAFVMCLCFDLTIVFSNVMAIKRYLRNNYGEVSKKMIVIPGFTKGVITNTILFLGINALTLVSGPIPDFSGLAVNINPYSFDIDGIYYIKSSFTKRLFKIFINNKTKELSEDKKCNFYEVLASDEKFQHLYSDWVKKKIGQDDPNVELIMIFNNNIGFLNIKSEDNILEQLFNNIVEYKVTNAYVKNVKINNETDLVDYVKNIHDIYFTFKNYNEESSGEFNLDDSVILIKEDINFSDKNVRKLGRYLDFPWNIDEKIIEFKDGEIVKIYQH